MALLSNSPTLSKSPVESFQHSLTLNSVVQSVTKESFSQHSSGFTDKPFFNDSFEPLSTSIQSDFAIFTLVSLIPEFDGSSPEFYPYIFGDHNLILFQSDHVITIFYIVLQPEIEVL